MRAVQQQHTEVGQALLVRWNMDPAIALMAAAHHAPTPPAPPDLCWSVCVLGGYLADVLVPEGDLTREAPPRQDVVDRCNSPLGIGLAVLKRMQGRLEAELTGIMEAFS